MKRRVLNLLTILSLLLCVAACVLGMRSYWVADAWGRSWQTHAVQAGLARGRLRLGYLRLLDGSSYGLPHFARSRYAAALDPPANRLPATLSNLGFTRERRADGGLVLVPLWFVTIIAAAGAAAAARSARRRLRAERLRAGRCPHCDYDLCATPRQCPECGWRREE